MATKAQQLFRTREKDDKKGYEDGRDFGVWYFNEDVQRMAWAQFQKTSSNTKKVLLEPYVFFDGLDGISFDKLMSLCKDKLLSSNKLYFPFIIKPELGGAHYYAGIVRRNSVNDEEPVLFLFNPVGHLNLKDKERFRKRMGLESCDEVAGMKMVLSPHPVQSGVKDGEKLVSCGPICFSLLQYALEHPEWVNKLDGQFQLPKHLMDLISADTEQYRKKITTIRQEHDQLLSTIGDLQFQQADECIMKANCYFMDKLMPKEADDDEEIYIDSDENVDCFRNEEHCSKGVEVVRKEIARLRANTWLIWLTWLFSTSALNKADDIEKALDIAIKNQVDDVRLDAGVRDKLGEHRLFSFFGCKKARALENIDQSLAQEQLIDDDSSTLNV